MQDIVYGSQPAASFMRWLRSFFRWRDVGALGIWLYQENQVTGQRRALRMARCHGPAHWRWLNGGPWEMERPQPPAQVPVARG